ncbi:uncharacterized protein N7483_009751 [Penicillium malachiteum]|uniref:uncharacterized protein n=1 Tax=Penicillium malachiteum TaxID=1324776 RepID=UPI0025495EB7|nr:uncharacterized protein N7483_009751 [Penicillium malachiteum]KAJ5721817.1 hypothetical protein N7483_009751 [Penicillium malachiteum]
MRSSWIFLNALVLGTARGLSLPFSLGYPFCFSTTTLTLSGDYTITSTQTVTSASSIVTVTGLPSVTVETITTTRYIPTAIACLQTGTTIKPYRSIGLFGKREPAPTAAEVSVDSVCSPTVTIIIPTISSLPCTELAFESFEVITDTKIVTTTAHSTTTIHPTVTSTVTEEWILPTPSSYKGVNYYQYLNDYFYPDGDLGCADCGYGGGGFETSDWNSNYSYYTNGTTQDINFESEDYPSYSTILCQLPGQASATDCGQWTVVFQGFLHATQTGNYTLAPTLGEDNALFFWLREKAYSSYANNNTDGGVSYTQPEGLPHSYAVSMVAGEFLPVTFIYANGYGPALNELTITSPNGTTYPDDLDFFVPPCPNSPFVP